MTAPRHVAVIDIGKTNAKLALVDLDTLTEMQVLTRPNAVLPGPPYTHFDTEGHWAFLLDGLAVMHREHGIDAVSVTAHGAAAALLDAGGGLAAPVLDYEDDGPTGTADAYAALRPRFAQTGSPRLALGLNLGAQIHWQLSRDPGLDARLAQVVTWPQYWGFRLTGVAACDVTSLGCHTDLWDPRRGTFSDLPARLGIRGRIAPPHRPADVLGRLLPAVVAATGLPPATPVLVGIHDSNASLYPHLLGQVAPFAVVSTGTWAVSMAVGGQVAALDPDRDCLINVDAAGRPVPSARFMGGRDFETLMQDGLQTGNPPKSRPGNRDARLDAQDEVLAKVMVMPSVRPGSGPFPQMQGGWVGGPTSVPAHRIAVEYYLALMTAECLSLTGAKGPVIVEGPMATARTYIEMLSAATGRSVLAATSATGTAIGAALLFAGPGSPAAALAAGAAQAPAGAVQNDPALAAYAARWRAKVASLPGGLPS